MSWMKALSTKSLSKGHWQLFWPPSSEKW